MSRYEKSSTIVTSNRPLEDWAKLLGDVVVVTPLPGVEELGGATGESCYISNAGRQTDPNFVLRIPMLYRSTLT